MQNVLRTDVTVHKCSLVRLRRGHQCQQLFGAIGVGARRRDQVWLKPNVIENRVGGEFRRDRRVGGGLRVDRHQSFGDKRGERGIFSKRLYTAQGQKAFDEIRRKYRADPEFRQTVEQYIHEFERLLEEVSRGDRGPSVVRNYLTSDTGKVYTLLAHAAGRFDQ